MPVVNITTTVTDATSGAVLSESTSTVVLEAASFVAAPVKAQRAKSVASSSDAPAASTKADNGIAVEAPAPKRGRPVGSKNKPKETGTPETIQPKIAGKPKTTERRKRVTKTG